MPNGLLLRGCLIQGILIFSAAASLESPAEELQQSSPQTGKQQLVKEEERFFSSGSLSKNSNVPVLPLRVQGRSCLFTIDTSTFTTILDNSLCKDLKPLPKGDRQESAPSLDLLQSPEITLGNKKVTWVSAVRAMDCKPLSKAFNQEILGVVGMEMLAKLVLTIDPDENLVTLTEEVPDTIRNGKRFSVAIARGNVPAVVVSLPGKATELFRIDTSLFTNGTIARSTYEQLSKTTQLEEPGKILRLPKPDDGAPLDNEAIIPHITAWGESLDPLSFRIADENRLGFDFLLRYRLSIDLSKSVIYSLPSRLLRTIDRNRQFGLRFSRDEGIGRIFSVEAGSPAAKAGLLGGEAILSINGFATDRNAFQAYRALGSPSPDDAVLECLQNGKQIRVSLPVEHDERSIDRKVRQE